MRTLAFSGGGSAGHIFPLVAVAESYRQLHPDSRLIYIGGEKDSAWLPKGVFDAIYSIQGGKLHRYLTFDLVKQPGKIFSGYSAAKKILQNENVSAVFCKGGFQSIPTALAARKLSLPLFAHESDSVPGLANTFVSRFVTNIFTAFPIGMYTGKFPLQKCLETGQPIRKEFSLSSQAKESVQVGGESFSLTEPYIVVIGGSQGAMRLNTLTSKLWGEITDKYRVLHIAGETDLERMQALRAKLPEDIAQKITVCNRVVDNLADVLGSAQYVISRSGGTIWELLELRVKMVLVPLSSSAGGHQKANADYFVTKGWATMIDEESDNALQDLRIAIDAVAETNPVGENADAATTIAKLLP